MDATDTDDITPLPATITTSDKLPKINENKPLVSVSSKLSTSTPKKRPPSGDRIQPTFPRTRRFSYESPERLKQLEKGFILDGVVLSRQTNEETGRSNPSINIGIPQYRAQKDTHCKSYFKMTTLPKEIPTDPMIGKVEDKFFQSSEATYYLKDRLEKGTSYTRRIYGGHTSVPTDPSKDGYNGPEGYRKNTFDLRRQRSVFDYEDPFDNPKPIHRRIRTQSAPATIKLMRQQSATAYRSYPTGSGIGGNDIGTSSLNRGGGRRMVQSALPSPSRQLLPVRELATGPV